MNIGNIPYHAFPSFGYAITAANKGGAYLPVPPGQVIYSYFKHVSGVPAPEGTQGVNISKLQILNTLIEQLEKAKNQNMPEISIDDQNEKQLNAMIEHYSNQIREMQTQGLYAPSAPAMGLLFNIAA